MCTPALVSGPAAGHLAGWAFVVGKTASCAAMALTVGAYVWPQHERLVAVGAVLVIVAVNLAGIHRTVAVTRVLLAVSLVALGTVIVSGWGSDGSSLDRLTPLEGGPLDVMRAAGFLFFAFAGYARIATLGEEVRDPETTIPKVVPRALGAVLVLYALVGVTLLAVVPIGAIAASDAPLRLVTDAAGFDSIGPVVRAGAAIASLGVLLNLIPGVSRTVLAMSRRRELPGFFSVIHQERSVPARAELAVGATVIVLVGVLQLRDAIGVSGVAVLTYYALTNASALRLGRDERRWPKPIAVAGLIGCVLLAASLPPSALISGIVAMVCGVAVRLILLRWGVAYDSSEVPQ